MPEKLRDICCLTLCLAFGLIFEIQSTHGQSDEIQTSVPSEQVDSGFLFNGKSPKTIEQLKYMEEHFAEISEKVKAATVNIKIKGSQGTGVVVSSDGYILTAAHVIGSPNQLAEITFVDESGKEKKLEAETLGSEKGIDSGMLKITDDSGDDFPYLDIAISEELKLGQWVMAIGHPGGIDEARGMVVRVGRIISSSKTVIRTDCTLVGGDSGGPLIDMNGDVIGIHSRIGSELVDNLHVPIDVFANSWDKLAQAIIIDGRPSLGLSVEKETNKIEVITAKGAAEIAGLKKGDVIVKLGEVVIEDKKDIYTAITRLNLRPNVITEVVVLRNGEEKSIELKVGDRMRVGAK